MIVYAQNTGPVGLWTALLNSTICITTQTDAICLKCPNNMQGICETESKVAEYDRQVLQRCGLTDGILATVGVVIALRVKKG